MNLEKMLAAQKALDERIVKEKGLEGKDLVANTYVSLDVELGEMANEARWFKHWSNDQEPRKESLLEEYVDALHFFLSIAIQKGLEDEIFVDTRVLKNSDFKIGSTRSTGCLVSQVGISNQYLRIKKLLYGSMSRRQKDKYYFSLAWFNFLVLGVHEFGFTLEQIEQAYFKKNKVNHQRQEDGY